MSYGTLADSKTYHAARGNTAWAAGSDPNLTIALLRGSEFIDFTYRGRFPGYKTLLRDQVREWPRNPAWDIELNSISSTTIPVEVEYASYEAALRELATPGILTPDIIPGEQIKRARVDGAVEVEYVGVVGVQGMRTMLTIIGGILAPVLTGTGTGSSLAGRSVRI